MRLHYSSCRRLASLSVLVVALALAPAGQAATSVVGYDSEAQLRQAVRASGGRVVRTIPSLHVAEVEASTRQDRFAAALLDRTGIDFVETVSRRVSAAEPALAPWSSATTPFANAPFEWQWAATRANAVPDSVLRAARAITVAVVDTGADLSAPDLRAKSPAAHSVVNGTDSVRDKNGHGTFVSSLAAGSVANGEGIAGFGGDVQLLVVQAGGPDGSFTDVDEAAAIVYAVDHGAKIINLSLGGVESSATERRAVEYAAAHGVLLVAAVGNEAEDGNPVEYPAALLQPPGSRGIGGVGLSVGASTQRGTRASFSNTGTHVSLVAPGEEVLGALSSHSSASLYPRFALPGSGAGLYGYSSGTSFAAPQVAGAAALVWAAKPSATALEVADILEQTASGRGAWNPALGYGVIDVAAAVATALGSSAPDTLPSLRAKAALRIGIKRAGNQVRLSARLRSLMPAISPARRLVRLQAKRGHRWRTIATARTDAAGRVRWAVRARGSQRLRVRYLGATDLTSASSRLVRVVGKRAPARLLAGRGRKRG
jgi:subtilase family protein/fervidolysin-like protein